MEVVHTIGRRKAAVARLYMNEGSGKIVINKKDLENYFPLPTLRYIVNQPLAVTNTEGQFDMYVHLDEVNKEEYRPVLKSNGFLHRDPRVVERKKPGQPKARKRFQFSKR